MITKPLPNGLGASLRRERESRALTQARVAAKAGISIPTLILLERDQGNIDSWSRVATTLSLRLRGKNLPRAAFLGKQLALLRKRRGIGQRGLAALMGVAQKTIVRLERWGCGRLVTLERALAVLGAGAALYPKGAAPKFYVHGGNSTSDHGWQTPRVLLEALYRVFKRFDLDPCSPTAFRRQAPVRAQMYYTVADDGLSLAWHGVVFVNPPYGRAISRWVAKAKSEEAVGHARPVLALIPARTDTQWWHEYVAGSATLFFLRGRLCIDDSGKTAPFPSALAVWGGKAKEIAALRRALSEAWMLSASGDWKKPAKGTGARQ